MIVSYNIKYSVFSKMDISQKAGENNEAIFG